MGCAFCAQQGHILRGCQIAREYVKNGRTILKNSRLYLPSGQPIPNDGSSRGLKSAIDAWIATNVPRASEAPATVAAPAVPARDPPPHMSLSFEVVSREMARIADAIESDDDSSDDDSSDQIIYSNNHEIYNTLEVEVLTAEKKKRDFKPSNSFKPAAEAQRRPPPSNAPPNPPDQHTSQYRFQSNAESDKLTDEASQWLFEGKLSLMTPAHLLAVSPQIRKNTMEFVRTRRVEAASFESSSAAPQAVDDPTTEPAYSLPLQEIDVLVGGRIKEPGVIDPSSQIVAIRSDLAREVKAAINPENKVEMEGANGLTSWTTGCAEYLVMRISDISFPVHAHVVKDAPFHLLLRRPFQHMVQSSLDEQPDGQIRVTIRDPRDRTRAISILSRDRLVRTGSIRLVAFQSARPPPRMAALEHHVINSVADSFRCPKPDPAKVTALAYKKVSKKVKPVPASLPEDFQIV
jgi:hypothetical protein